jgi:hypothetical protein
MAVAVFRSRLTLGPATAGAFLGALGFLIGGAIVAWAGAHVVMVNDVRLDVAPSGENLWLRNRLAEHAALVFIVPACLLPLLGFSTRTVFTKRSHDN